MGCHISKYFCWVVAPNFCLAIIKGPPNDIYFIIEEPFIGLLQKKGHTANFFILSAFSNHLIWENDSSPTEPATGSYFLIHDNKSSS